MKKIATTVFALLAVWLTAFAQGWPQNYGGVMLQGFYWDSYEDTKWTNLTSQADEISKYFDLMWVPNSGQAKADQWNTYPDNKDMGYMPCYWLRHNTCFGTQEELVTMIQTYTQNSTGIIEDVVINHKNGLKDWCDFPDETYTNGGGKTYELNWTLADICNNDNGGYVKTKFNITGANDTGTDFDGCRDLDHTGANVQKNVKTYLDFLKSELGYAGFRYDMVKGYAPEFVGIYNVSAQPTYSVGEAWDSWDGVTWWVDGTKQNGVIQSAAFDFPLKFLINDAFKNGNWNALATQGMAGSTKYQRYSVTFVDNHDTYRDDNKMDNDKRVLAANAFILAMPGTPCVFLPHWKAHKESIGKMIAARQAAGITNQSTFESYAYEDNGSNTGRIFYVHGTKGTIMLTLGHTPNADASNYDIVVSGDASNNDFCFYVSNDVTVDYDNIPKANTNRGSAIVSTPSGTYYQNVSVTLAPSDPFTSLIYKQDNGAEQTITSATTLNFDQTTTLSVKVEGSDEVKTYRYVVTNEEINKINIYVRADKSPIYLYAWDSNGTLTNAWPGTLLTEKKSIDGVNYYVKTFPKSNADYTLNYILSQGDDAAKTSDQTGVGSDVFTALGDGTLTDLAEQCVGQPVQDAIEEKSITVYVEANQQPLYLYVWDSTGTKLNGEWPGTQLTDVILVKDKAWYRKTFNKVDILNITVNKGKDQPQSKNFEGITDDVFVSYDGNSLTTLTDETSNYAGYPKAWYEQGEVCAFFIVPNGWESGWNNICCYAYRDNTFYTEEWRGDACKLLGYNEEGAQIWKWTCNSSNAGEPQVIIFNSGTADNGNSGTNQTENLTFVNGAWYSAESYIGSGKTSPVSTAVAPSEETSVVAENAVTATNWNGKQEKVAGMTSNNTFTKTLNLQPGTYTVQAIVRGTAGATAALSAESQTDNAALTGMIDGAESTVATNGTVERFKKGTNNGWQKTEVSFTLSEAKKVEVTVSATAAEWQLGALSVTTNKATKATAATTETYYDATQQTGFSFFERGANPNALILANSEQDAAKLSYNVIANGVCRSLVLTDGAYDFGNTGDTFTASNASYSRTFTPGQKSTICLPFSLTEGEAATTGTYYRIGSYNAETGNIHFAIEKAPQAYTPYVFVAAKAQPFEGLTNKTVHLTNLVNETIDGLTFKGTMTRQELKSVADGTTYYGYSTTGAFSKVSTEGAFISPFRAYIVSDKPLTSARLVASFDEESTLGITELSTQAAARGKATGMYNLSGQRVSAPTRKGLYIIDGRKYFVK